MIYLYMMYISTFTFFIHFMNDMTEPFGSNTPISGPLETLFRNIIIITGREGGRVRVMIEGKVGEGRRARGVVGGREGGCEEGWRERGGGGKGVALKEKRRTYFICYYLHNFIITTVIIFITNTPFLLVDIF